MKEKFKPVALILWMYIILIKKYLNSNNLNSELEEFFKDCFEQSALKDVYDSYEECLELFCDGIDYNLLLNYFDLSDTYEDYQEYSIIDILDYQNYHEICQLSNTIMCKNTNHRICKFNYKKIFKSNDLFNIYICTHCGYDSSCLLFEIKPGSCVLSSLQLSNKINK